MKAYAVRIADAELLRRISSGGAFTALARAVLSQGGCAFGCVWKRPEMTAVHAKAECDAELAPLRGSKYVRSDISSALPDVVLELQKGRIVLFTGTTCQIAAARQTVRTKYPEASDRFVGVEIICHGAPMPEVWEAYKRGLKKPLADVSFKDKTTGWNDPTLRMVFADGEVREGKLYSDPYVRAFENGLSQPKVCFSCPFKNGASGANITIGDCWGVEKLVPAWTDDRGASCVIVHDEIGAALFDRARPELDCREVAADEILRRNPNYARPLSAHPKWKRFQRNYRRAPFGKLVTTLLDGPWLVRLVNRIVRGVRRRL